MTRYAVLRLLQAVPLLVLLSLVTFAMLTAAPGDPAQALLVTRGGGAPPRPEDIARVRQNLGLDDPWLQRYGRWVTDALRGDFGTSYLHGQSVRAILRDVVPPTLLLTGTALVLTVAGAIALGLAAGLTAGSLLARGITALSLVLYSTPTFVIGLLGVYFFSAEWRLFPSSGMTDAGADVTVSQMLRHLVLPALVLAIGHHLAAYARIIEVAVVETRAAGFVQNAIARGLPTRVVVLRHILRASLIPFVAQLGTSFGGLVAGAYAVEVIFSWPGMGRTALQAATGRDYPLLMAIVLLTGATVVLGNLLADLVVAALDARIRLGRIRAAAAGAEIVEIEAAHAGLA